MPRPRTKTKNEDLARIRRNQQRSRARRQEYIRRLETTVKEYENTFAAKELIHQTSLHRLQTENDSMKRLLDALGVSHGLLSEFEDGLGVQNPTYSSAILPQATGFSLSDSATPPSTSPPLHVSPCETTQDSLQATPGLDGFPGMEAQLPLVEYHDLGYLDALPRTELGPDHPWKADANTKLFNDTNKRTTLCSLAYRLIVQCNRRGVDLDVLYIQMQRGFQQGRTATEGCRVDNQVLLAILTEIS